MMKSLVLLLFVFTIGILGSCGDDEGCDQSDWTGTYALDESNSTCSANEIETMITIERGASSGYISLDGLEIAFVECAVTDGPSGLQMSLDGNVLSVTQLGCRGEYVRQ